VSQLLLGGAASCAQADFHALRPRLDARGAPSAHGAPARPTCVIAFLYVASGDQLTFRGGSIGAIDEHGGGGSGGGGDMDGTGIRFSLEGYDGEAALLADGQVVDELVIDRAFIDSRQVALLEQELADGTSLEYHVYASDNCSAFSPAEPLTRDEVEAFES
jgi:hypothetical protein